MIRKTTIIVDTGTKKNKRDFFGSYSKCSKNERRLSERPFPSCLLPQCQNESVRNHSNENEFDLHENGRAGETNFHKI